MKNQIRAIVIEDESLGRRNLIEKISKNCPQIEIIGECSSGKAAIHMIPKLHPDLVFLDVQLGTVNGLDVLARLKHINFEVIFTTAYEDYAIDAIKADALDYLLKPIDEKELYHAVEKAYKRIQSRNIHISRISLPVKNGYRFINLEEIVYCEANDNKTIIHFYNGREVEFHKTLRELESRLPSDRFKRIHRSFLINMDFLESFSREDGGYVMMINEIRLPVSKTRHHFLSSTW